MRCADRYLLRTSSRIVSISTAKGRSLATFRGYPMGIELAAIGASIASAAGSAASAAGAAAAAVGAGAAAAGATLGATAYGMAAGAYGLGATVMGSSLGAAAVEGGVAAGAASLLTRSAPKSPASLSMPDPNSETINAAGRGAARRGMSSGPQGLTWTNSAFLARAPLLIGR
jgi:hypothetical protein